MILDCNSDSAADRIRNPCARLPMSRALNLISLVLPIYNEEEVLPLLLARLDQLLWRLPCPAEVVFVNDGSQRSHGRLAGTGGRRTARI